MARDRRPENKGRHKDHHGKDDDDGKKKPPPPAAPPPGPGDVTESLKAVSTQTGNQALNAAPSVRPAEPANAEAVYTTGPGQAVEYNYTRQGTYADEYAYQQSQASAPVPPIAGSGQVVTSGAANNAT